MDNIFADGGESNTSNRNMTAEEYADLVRRSHLADEAEFDHALHQFQASPKKRGNDAWALAFHLIQAGMLTRWQTKMLMQGRWRGFVLGKYRLLDRIGSGGMSSVYLAEHQLMRRRVAIKVLPPLQAEKDSRLNRFLAESRAVAQLDHPHIVRAYHLDVEFDRYYLVMEYIEGVNLQQLIEREGPLSFYKAAEYLRQAAKGLAHAHQAGLIHRDIKPANFLVDRTDTVKLLDLGLARSLDPNATSLTNDRNGKVLGTADYVAPEQVKDSHDVDERTDIYGLGCTMYFLLTGQPPFAEGNLAQKLAMHLYHQPANIREIRPDTPLALVRLCHKMMAKKREDRYQTAAEVQEVLEQWVKSQGNGEQAEEETHELGPDTSLGDSLLNLDDVPETELPEVVESSEHQQESEQEEHDEAEEQKQEKSAEKTAPRKVAAEAEDEASSTQAVKTAPPKRSKKSSKRRRRPSSKRKRPREFPEVLTLEETAEYLRLPADKIEGLAQQGKIPCQQILDQWRFHKKAIEQWLHEADFRSQTWMNIMPGRSPDSISLAMRPSITDNRLTLEDYLERLKTSGIYTEDQWQQVLQVARSLPSADPEDLGRALRNHELLTDYQSALLRQGKLTGLRYGDYLVLERVGSGGTAVVYRAKHQPTGQIVALKVMQQKDGQQNAEEASRFDREVRAVAKLNHPNIVMAYDAVYGEKEHYLVLEYVEGVNLDHRVRRGGPLPVAEAVEYILQAACGLQHAHSKHLVHRDIKPGNLLLDKNHTIKILDLGLVRFEQHLSSSASLDGSTTRLTKSETVLGTPDYMPPEQFADARQADNRADIYSLGCTMYFLLTGRSPFEYDSPTRTLKAHQTEPIPDLLKAAPNAPTGLQPVFEKMMAKEPRSRYQSMQEVIHDIERFVLPEIEEFHPDEPPKKSSKSRKSSSKAKEKPEQERGSLFWSTSTVGIGTGLIIGSLLGIFSWYGQIQVSVRMVNVVQQLVQPIDLPPELIVGGFGGAFCAAIGFMLAQLQGE